VCPVPRVRSERSTVRSARQPCGRVRWMFGHRCRLFGHRRRPRDHDQRPWDRHRRRAGCQVRIGYGPGRRDSWAWDASGRRHTAGRAHATLVLARIGRRPSPPSRAGFAVPSRAGPAVPSRAGPAVPPRWGPAVSRERAQRRAAREEAARQERLRRERRQARRRRWQWLTAPFRLRRRTRRRVGDSALRRQRRRQDGALAAVLVGCHGALWLMQPSWTWRGSAAVLTLFAWPVLTVVLFDRRPSA